jgi:hypothetical protein
MTPTHHEIDLNSAPVKFSGQSIDDDMALSLVMSTFDKYSRYRQNSHEERWKLADALYCGVMPARYWEGTEIPRSSIPVAIVMEQIEAVIPIITNSLFNQSRDWFQVEPMAGTSLQEARQVQERLCYLLETPRDSAGSVTARKELDLAIKQLLLYGNGGISIEIDANTGDPTVRWSDIRDIYIDPACKTPNIDDGRSSVYRTTLTIEQLESMRGQDGINLPPKDMLMLFADNMGHESADNVKMFGEAIRGGNYQPSDALRSDFNAKKAVELLIYTDEARIIWVLDKRWVMFNGENENRFQPYAFAPCIPIPGRWHAMSFADALEMEQKYAQAILNGKLDELALSLNPPRVTKRRNGSVASRQYLRPGLQIESENPKEDYQFILPQGLAQNGWQEMSWIQAAAERKTGATSIVTSGQPVRSNASRTTAGIQAQQAGPTARIQRIVEMIEDYLIVPMLYKMQAMDSANAVEGAPLNGLNPENGESTEVNPSALGKNVRYRMMASSRMLTQSKLAQVIPFLSQYIMNGAFMGQLAKAGKTVDFEEFFNMVQDSTGTKQSYKLVRSLTEEEKAAMSQPPPEAIMSAQQADKSNQVRLQIAQMKQEGDLQAAMLSGEISKEKSEEATALQLLQMMQASKSMEKEAEKQRNGTDYRPEDEPSGSEN